MTRQATSARTHLRLIVAAFCGAVAAVSTVALIASTGHADAAGRHANSAGSATSEPANGKIAFSIDNEVWVMNADGSNPTNFTDGDPGSGFAGGDETAWSPDGTKILYGTQDTVYSEGIFWRSADGGVAQKIVDNRTVPTGLNRNGVWSGDGTKIAFASLVNGQYDIYSINTDGTGLANLTENAAHDLNPAWSHDGTKIAFASNRSDGFFDIWVMDADGSNPERLTNAIGSDQWPRWSPDDSQIVFWSTRDSDDEIYKMDAGGSHQVRLTTSLGVDGYPNWSPDGSKIVFMSQRDQDIRHLFVMNPDGSDQTQISDVNGAIKPDWQPVSGPPPPPPPPPPGTIRIFLDANPDGPQDFAFTGSGAIGNFDLDDDSDLTLPSSRSFTGLSSGSYTVQQIVPNGWTAVGLTCDDPDGGTSTDLPAATATIDLDPGETVNCQYLDVPAPSTRIRIVVDAVPDDAQDFAFSGSGAIGGFDLDDDADAALPSSRLFPLSPGSYTVQQTVPGGWNLTGLACDDLGSTTDLGTATATIDLDAGETVTCTYTDAPEPPPASGTIRIELDAVPDDPKDFTYIFQGQEVGIAVLDDDADPTLASSISFPGLSAGSYQLGQDVPSGWQLTGLTCSDPSAATDLAFATATFVLDPGETVTCTYTDTKAVGTMVIQLDAVPDHPQDFAFVFEGTEVGIAVLDDDADPALESRVSFPGLTAGGYTIHQNQGSPPSGWDLTGLACTDPDGGSSANLATGTATVDLDPGETVTCTYTETARPGSITIVKDAVPDVGRNFSFTGSGAIPNFQLDDDDTLKSPSATPRQRTFSRLAPGGYSIQEQSASGGWYLTGLTCNDPDGGTIVSLANRRADVDLDPGETVTCVFTNTPTRVVIVKDAVPDANRNFSFTGSGAIPNFQLDDDDTLRNPSSLPRQRAFPNLDPGEYRIQEQAASGGWYLTGLSCDDPDGGTTVSLANRRADVDLDPGETVTCVFTNTPTTIVIVEDSLPDATRNFSFTGSGAIPNFQLDDDDTLRNPSSLPRQRTFSLDSGLYTVNEQTPAAGWSLTNLTCNDPDGGTTVALGNRKANVDLDPGETVTCTFTNTRSGG